MHSPPGMSNTTDPRVPYGRMRTRLCCCRVISGWRTPGKICTGVARYATEVTKEIFSPLRDAAKRARSHIDNLTEEDPLIIDPGGADDPRDHIQFRREFAVGLTDAGRTTVRVIGLNRIDLVEERLARLDELGRLLDIVRIWERRKVPEFADLVETTRRLLEEAIAPEAEFSAMAADYFSGV